MHLFRQLFAASALAWLVGCGNSAQTSPATSPTSPSLPGPQSYVVSGTVSETVDGISRPVASRKVDIYISPTICDSGQPNKPCLPEGGGVVETDQNGRYTLAVTVLPKTLVFVTGAGLHALGQQPCLASALVDKDTTIDVEVFPEGSATTSPPSASPMITGLVYETTPQGRNPLRGVLAWLEVGWADSFPIAKTQTDDAGHFFFCRVNAQVRMYVGSYKLSEVRYVGGTGDMFFEIEVKR